MQRQNEIHLKSWYQSSRRKPLVLRGARQVGKSTLVRQFANDIGLQLHEINLERQLQLEPVFASLDINAIRMEIEAILKHPLSSEQGLLFLDEIQATPSALQALRYLYEEIPSLPVIAAGSLLEFTLSDHSFSMPVGRIEYHHLGPMDFREFLAAVDPGLLEYLDRVHFGKSLPITAHINLLNRYRHFLFVGGMPEAVRTFVETGSLEAVSPIHRSIIDTYEDDFAKYARRDDLVMLQRVFRQIPRQVGKKVKYVNYSREHRARDIRKAINLLVKARTCTEVHASHCTGVPLEAEVYETVSKLLFLDVGLMNHVCGMDWLSLQNLDDLTLVNEGAVAEQAVGQHLAYRDGGLAKPSLVYWLREGRSNNAEVDYVLSHGPDLFPVEVKAGKQGTLRSLHQFTMEKKCRAAVRFDLNQASLLSAQTNMGCDLLSLPLYAASELPRLLSEYRRGT